MYQAFNASLGRDPSGNEMLSLMSSTFGNLDNMKEVIQNSPEVAQSQLVQNLGLTLKRIKNKLKNKDIGVIDNLITELSK